MTESTPLQAAASAASAMSDGTRISGAGVVRQWASEWKKLLFAPLAAGVVALGATYLVAPTFTARALILPPQPQSGAMSTLASLTGLAGLSGGAAGRTPADQYVALLSSASVQDRLIGRFQLLQAYSKDYQVDARTELERSTRIVAGKRDGLISIEVDDKDPKRAAAIANQYVEELRRLTSELAITEAQQRRVFFDAQLKETTARLAKAQAALQTSGFNAGAMKAEPKAAAEEYARLRAQMTTAQVRLRALKSTLMDNAPEIIQQQASVDALRSQVALAEQSGNDGSTSTEYLSKYREFKYQEALFEMFARQYELARVDESREGALIQVVDTATVPERKSKPQRGVIALSVTLAAALLLAAFIALRPFWVRTG